MYREFTMDDMASVCSKCQQAYYRDFIYLDCDYCPLPQVIEDNYNMRAELKKIKERYEDDGR